MELVSHSAEYMRSNANYPQLTENMNAAEHICRGLISKYNKNMLLHGDLHHENILLDCRTGQNQYKIIDPIGVIGSPVFDIPWFLIVLLISEGGSEIDKKYSYITRTTAENLDIPEHDIRQLLYVETCRQCAKSVQSGTKPPEYMVSLADMFKAGY